MISARLRILIASTLAILVAGSTITMATGSGSFKDGHLPGTMSRPETGDRAVGVTAPPSQMAPIIEVLIQDNLISRVDNEIRGLKSLIRSLPEGSRVLTGYITTGTLNVTQDFTTDRNRAAASLRILRGESAAPYNPYVELIEGLKRFDSQPQGRRIVLLVSDGLDLSHGFADASPAQSLDLDRSIRLAQQRGVAVFSFFAPEASLAQHNSLLTNFGQGSLSKLADKTGGKAFYTGTTFVSFSPYIKAFRASLGGV